MPQIKKLELAHAKQRPHIFIPFYLFLLESLLAILLPAEFIFTIKKFGSFSQKVYAQSAQMARGIAVDLLQIEEKTQDGNIISNKDGKYVLSREPFDQEIYGVVVPNSTITLTSSNEQKTLVLRNGEAQVLVSNSNGQIKKGDYITSSNIPGVAQKADKSGFVVGRALQDFQEEQESIKLIWVLVEPRFAYINNTTKTNLLEALKSGALSPLLNPVESLRYILAVLIVASTFIIGFSTFGKTSGRTIEALGRNPLAQGSIKAAMIFNIILSFGIMLIGLALAYLILVL